MAMGGALKCIVRCKSLCDHVLGEFTLYGVITKQIFLICPKFEGKVVSQSWKHLRAKWHLKAGSTVGKADTYRIDYSEPLEFPTAVVCLFTKSLCARTHARMHAHTHTHTHCLLAWAGCAPLTL